MMTQAESSGGEGHIFRAARSDDLEAVMELYRQLHPNDPHPEPGTAVAVLRDIISAPGMTLFLLELEGSICASTYLNIIPNLTRSASPYAVIENVIVEQSLRGTGLGKQIVAATLQVAWDAGCYKAMLMTGSRTPATHAFYRACGFSPDEKTAYLARPS
jgi:GNAT superfamily N-acetyltransferase